MVASLPSRVFRHDLSSKLMNYNCENYKNDDILSFLFQFRSLWAARNKWYVYIKLYSATILEVLLED